MTPELIPDPNPEVIAKVEVLILTQSKAIDRGLEITLPEGKTKAVYAIARDAEGLVLGTPKVMEGVDDFKFDFNPEYNKEVKANVRELLRLDKNTPID